jgi:hypothetical protein
VSDPVASDRYQRLSARIETLRGTFIADLEVTEAVVGAQYDRLCAYLVLCHAEFEQYLEDSSVEVLARAHSAWLKDEFPRVPLLSLLACSPLSVKPPPAEKSGGESFLRLGIQDARSRHYQYAKFENHGISEKYLLALLLPAGIKETDLGGAWLQHVADLAQMRGQVAHHSSVPALYAESPISLSDALTAVGEVLAGIERLDVRLLALMTEEAAAPQQPVANLRNLP